MAIETAKSTTGTMWHKVPTVKITALFGILCIGAGGMAGCSNATELNRQVEAETVEGSDRLQSFEKATSACGIGKSENFKILDGGEALHLSTRTDLDSLESKVWPDDIECLLSELDAPSALWIKMSDTKALDGRQVDVWNGLEASWAYHPDDGLNLIIEHDTN